MFYRGCFYNNQGVAICCTPVSLNLISIFSIPKPFIGEVGRLQRNALSNWRALLPNGRIILFGNEEGIADAARQFGAIHERSITVNEFGTPMVDDAFRRASDMGETPLLMYSNSDILYDDTVLRAGASSKPAARFILSGRRTDVDVAHDLSTLTATEWKDFVGRARSCGRLHGPAGMDYFIFPRTQNFEMPHFAVGRVGWDSWLVWKCRTSGIPFVDCTGTITAIHQNHDYTHLKLGRQHERGPERDSNIRSAGGLGYMLTLREADWVLENSKLRRPHIWEKPGYPFAALRAYRWFLQVKRRILA